MQVVGPHHASASEAFPARAGVADWKTQTAGAPGAGVEGPQQWQAVEPPPVNPLDADGPGKRKVPWAGGVSNLAARYACFALAHMPNDHSHSARMQQMLIAGVTWCHAVWVSELPPCVATVLSCSRGTGSKSLW